MKEILQQHKFDGEILEDAQEDSQCSIECINGCHQFDACVTKHNSAITVYELVTMTEFVKKVKPNKSKNVQWISSKNAIDAERYLVIDKYADFITQPLTKEMFIGDSRIFEGWEIVDFGKWTKGKHIYGKWITNGEEHLFSECSERWCLIGRNRTIEQALNNGVKLYWNGKTI